MDVKHWYQTKSKKRKLYIGCRNRMIRQKPVIWKAFIFPSLAMIPNPFIFKCIEFHMHGNTGEIWAYTSLYRKEVNQVNYQKPRKKNYIYIKKKEPARP